ncbi:hypothetical protein [Vibrio vulnificus]|uniref:hypothetical protein n=1 Tax=Vibrio vulnificus TaxID=672 RepID=UPI003242A84A
MNNQIQHFSEEQRDAISLDYALMLKHGTVEIPSDIQSAQEFLEWCKRENSE